jgi:zinc protease
MSRSSRRALALAMALLVSWRTSVSSADADETPLPLDSEARKTAPAPGPEPAFSLPPIHATVLDNGIRVLLIERHELPLVAVRAVVMRGIGDAAPGVAWFAERALFQGTTTHTGSQLRSAYDGIDALTEEGLSYDTIYIGAEVLSARLGDALRLMAESLRYSQVPDQPFDTGRSKMLAYVAAHAGDPSNLVQSAIDEALYPVGHPYREPLAGDASALRAVRRDQVLSFFRGQVEPDTTAIVVAGDVDRFRLENLVNASFGDWRGQAPPRVPIPEVHGNSSAPRVVLVDRFGGTQATITLAALGVSRDCPERQALFVLNAILGSRSGRLSTELREARGSTYGAGTSMPMARGPRPFVLSTSVQPNKVGEATSFMLAEVRRITAEPVSPDELAYGKGIVRGGRPVQFTSLRGTLDALSDLATSQRPIEDYTRLSQQLAALTPDTLLRVAKQYLRPDELRIFVVARGSAVKDQLKSLGLGRVQILSASRREDATQAIAVDSP